MFHEIFRHLVPDRPWQVAVYSPPFAAAAADHGASWVTCAGLLIGAGGLSCHIIQTAIRVREHLASSTSTRK